MLKDAEDLALFTDDERCLIVHSSLLSMKPTRSSQGVSVVTLRGKKKLKRICLLRDAHLADTSRYRARAIPKAPSALKPEDKGEEQLSLL